MKTFYHKSLGFKKHLFCQLIACFLFEVRCDMDFIAFKAHGSNNFLFSHVTYECNTSIYSLFLSNLPLTFAFEAKPEAFSTNPLRHIYDDVWFMFGRIISTNKLIISLSPASAIKICARRASLARSTNYGFDLRMIYVCGLSWAPRCFAHPSLHLARMEFFKFFWKFGFSLAFKSVVNAIWFGVYFVADPLTVTHTRLMETVSLISVNRAAEQKILTQS